RDWHGAYVIGGSRVFLPPDPGATAGGWTDTTGNLLATGIREVLSIAFIPTGTGTDGVVLVGTDIGVLGTAMKTDTVWSVFGSTQPRTFAFSVVYAIHEDKL